MPVETRVLARGLVHTLLLVAATAASSCRAPARVTLPSGAGAAFPDFVSAFTEATSACEGVKTMSASLSLSGRAGSTRLAARIDAGFAAPARLRLEGYPRVHFGGKPFFVLVADGDTATLVLTRDDRVLQGAAPSAIVEALAGVALNPGELRALVSGCALGAAEPRAGRSFDKGWAAVDTPAATLFLRQQDGHWRLVAARRGALTIEYSAFADRRPSTVHLYTTAGPGTTPADLTLRISQVEINTPLSDAVFQVEVPRTATPLSLEELRGALRTTESEGTEDAGAEETENAGAEETESAEAEETENAGQDQHGGAEARRRDAGLASRAALRAANRAWNLKYEQPRGVNGVCVSGSALDSTGRPEAGPRLPPPCLRASALIPSRALRPLRPRALRPLRPRTLRPLRQSPK
jgi:outer membrane lipoprotein-sorting protein